MERTVILTGGSPWGFTLSGGRDFGSHLRVLKLTSGGKAMVGGVREQDFILSINSQDTQGVAHFGAQQLIKSSGQKLTLILSSEEPLKSAYSLATEQATPTPSGQAQSGRPRPPPPPQTTPTTPTPSVPKTTTPVKVVTPVKPVQPVSKPVANEESETDPIFQSPTFKKITSDGPFSLSPKSEQNSFVSPPTQALKQMTVEDGNTRKSTQRPPPPSNSPSTFTTTTMKVSSANKGQSPITKPSPPPIKRPPVSSTSSAGSQPPLAASGEGGSQDKLTARQGVCEACKQPIRGSYSSAMNKVWHSEHFICSHCRTPLTGGTFIFEEDKIFCNDCYERKIAQICSLCRKPIVGPMVNATNRHYHHECFRCSKCGNNLSQQEGFNMENKMLFCSGCFSDVYGVACYGCGQKVGVDELWVEALEHTWHPQCFVCGGCKRPLEGSKFFAKLGQPYCGHC